MSNPVPQHVDFSSRIKLRRAIPLASAVTAMGLAGCTMAPPANPAAASGSPESRQATNLVKAYTSDIEMALDKVDRERLRAAADKKNQSQTQTIVKVTTSQGTTSATLEAPAPLGSNDAAVGAAPAPVLLATAVPSEVPVAVTPPKAPEPVVAERPVAVAPVAIVPPVSVANTVVAKPAPVAASAHVMPPAVAIPETPVAVVSQPPAPVAAPVVAAVAAANPAVQGEITPEVITRSAPGAVLPFLAMPVNGVVVSPMSGTALVPPTVVPATPEASAASAMVAMTAVAVPAAPEVVAPAVAVEPTVDDALAVLRKNIGEHPTLSTALALALLDSGKSNDLIKSLSPSDQKLAGDLLSALEVMKTAAPNATLSDRAGPLVEVANKWQADADLSLPRMVLATRVDSFGVFTEANSSFEQGKRHTVIIYCEVANFGSQKDGDDFTTRLSQQESLITEDGLLVWRPNPEDIEDKSKNQRHDFYLVKKLTLPETLAAGKYTLRMTVTDKTKNRTSVINRPIEIVGK